MILFICLIGMTVLGAVASLFLKRASEAMEVVSIIKNPDLYFGGSLYVIAILLNIYVLKYLDYSVVLPVSSLTYGWTMVVSYFVLKEKITGRKILGVGLIGIGAILVTMS